MEDFLQPIHGTFLLVLGTWVLELPWGLVLGVWGFGIPRFIEHAGADFLILAEKGRP